MDGEGLVACRYRASTASPTGLRTSVLVPVYDEPEDVRRLALASVVANRPSELIAVMDGGDLAVARVAAETDVVVVLDSDTIWRPVRSPSCRGRLRIRASEE